MDKLEVKEFLTVRHIGTGHTLTFWCKYDLDWLSHKGKKTFVLENTGVPSVVARRNLRKTLRAWMKKEEQLDGR